MRKSRKKVLCSALALTLAATTVFGTAPVTQAKTAEVVQEIAQANAENSIKLHVKGKDVKIYVWGNGATGGFPGASMESDSSMGEEWYYYEVPADCTGFIISSNGQKITDDIKGMAAGEYWVVDGDFSTTNPGGTTTPATPTPVVTPEPKGISIDSVTPENGANIKVGEPQTISVEATSILSEDGVVYYKYEVKHNGSYVGEHYYSKSNTWTFTPTEEGTYTVTISVQAHNEENTTEVAEYSYTASNDGAVFTPGPTDRVPATATPTAGVPENTPAASDDSGNNGGNQQPGNATNAPVTPTYMPGNATNAPGMVTPTPGAADQPGEAATQAPNMDTGATNAPAASDAPKATNAVQSTAAPATDATLSVVSFTTDVSSPVKIASSVTLSAEAKGGTAPYTYEFYYTRSGDDNEYIIQDASSESSCTWRPIKAGTYTLYVTVADKNNATKTKEISGYVVKGMSLSARVNKKSPQRKKTAIKITASTTGATGNVTYQFVIRRGSKITKKTSFKSAKTLIWKPTKAGSYKITIFAKDKYGKVSITKNYKIR